MATKNRGQRGSLRRTPAQRITGLAVLALTMTAFGACSGSDGPVDTTPLPGSLQIATVTSGFLKDDGYDLVVNGTNRGAIGADDQVTLTDLEPGTYQVSLDGVADNCSVDGGSVSVVAEQTATLELAVTCQAGEPAPMTIRASRDRPDLDTGVLVQCNFGLCPSDAEWDLYVEFNAQSQPQSIVRQNTVAGLEIAHVVGVPLAELTEEAVNGAVFTAELEDRAFSSGSTILLRTTSGAVFALGNPTEDTLLLTTTFDALLIAPGA